MALATRNREIAVAIEAQYGKGAAPGAFTPLLAIDADLPSLDAQEATRNTIEPHLGAKGKYHWQKRWPLKWSHEAIGSGDVTVPPHFDAMLRASGWARVALTGTATVAAQPVAVGLPVGALSYTVATGYTGLNRRRVQIACTTAGASGVAKVSLTAPACGLGETREPAYSQLGVLITDGQAMAMPGGASIEPTVTRALALGDSWTIELVPPGIEYWPSSARRQHESAVVKYNVDGQLTQALGARFQLSADWAIGGFGTLSFSGRGLYAEPNAVPLGDPDFSHIKDPQVLDSETFALAIDGVDGGAGYAPIGQSFKISGGAEVRSKSRTNLDNVEISDHALTGELLIEAPDLATWNAWASLDGYAVIRATRGTRIGERCEITVTHAQIGKVSTSEDNEDWMATIPFVARPLSGGGDDEVCVRFF